MKKSNYDYLLLFAGTLALAASNGVFEVPFVIWISPFFIIHFLKKKSPWRGILIFLPFSIVSQIASSWGFFPFSDATMYYIFPIIGGCISGIIIALPFFINRLLAERYRGFLGTLVFPLAITSILYLNSLRPDLGSIFTLASLQWQNLVLMQFVSIAGVWGLGFIMTWFSSMLSWVIDNRHDWNTLQRGVIIYSGIVAVILLYGGIITNYCYPAGKTVRVAMVTLPKDKSIDFNDVKHVLKNKMSRPIEDEIAMIRSMSDKAEKAGAKIIVWQEASLAVQESDNSLLMKSIETLSRDKDIYLLLSYIEYQSSGPAKNKAVLFDPSGKMAAVYEKNNPVEGVETPWIARGSTEIPVIASPYGRLAVSICYDINFPRHVRSAVMKDVDIMLNPSLDWKEVAVLTTSWVLCRAHEYGFSLVRSTGTGISFASDYQGRILAFTNYFTSDQHITYADVPVKGVKTLYGLTGDLFAWLCMAILAAMVIMGLRARTDRS